MDSVPIVAITGQVASAAIGTDAFQEADIRGITMPITKHSFLVTKPDGHPARDRGGVPHRQHRTARPGAGRHRQGRPAGAGAVPLAAAARPARLPTGDQAARQAGPRGGEADRRGHPPVLYVGGGVVKAGASEELAGLVELTGIPVITTLMARGVFPDSHPLNLGMPGMHGTVAGGRRAAAQRPADRPRHPVRRPGDRQAGHVRARWPRSSTPTSTRPRSPRTGWPTSRSSATART